MTCSEFRDLLVYDPDDTSEGTIAAFKEHRENCPACEEYLAEVGAKADMLYGHLSEAEKQELAKAQQAFQELQRQETAKMSGPQ
jgi:predicted anti-sigma-YlaC factor YlaD